jgi:hypothetical protein
VNLKSSEGLNLTLNLLDAWDGGEVASGSREDGWLAEPFDGFVMILQVSWNAEGDKKYEGSAATLFIYNSIIRKRATSIAPVANLE